MSRQALADEVSAILGEPIKFTEMRTGSNFRAANGNAFYLFHTSKATAEHIAGCLKR